MVKATLVACAMGSGKRVRPQLSYLLFSQLFPVPSADLARSTLQIKLFGACSPIDIIMYPGTAPPNL